MSDLEILLYTIDGCTIRELSGGGYVRMPVVMLSMGRGSVNENDVRYAEATEDWSTVHATGISLNGHLVSLGMLNRYHDILKGDTLYFASGSINTDADIACLVRRLPGLRLVR